jgi:hypothetical protein
MSFKVYSRRVGFVSCVVQEWIASSILFPCLVLYLVFCPCSFFYLI